MYYPTHIQIEVIAGFCTAKCVMCTIAEINRKGVMSIEDFLKIITKLEKGKEKIKHITLHGMGEPLLDPSLPEKISLLKKRGFRGIGFATNATNLTEELSTKLLKSGLDTIIFSVDGLDSETHESIRVGTNYERIIENIKRFIRLRNEFGQTKIIVRMIRQSKNYHQWQNYKKYWFHLLNPTFGDLVAAFDLHNHGTLIDGREGERHVEMLKISQKKIVCHDLIERLIILLDGHIALCCADEKGEFDLGNIFEMEVEEIYNNKIFNDYRNKMREGRLLELDYCKNCQIIVSRLQREFCSLS